MLKCPSTKSDILYLLSKGMSVGEFAQHRQVDGKWYCEGTHEIQNGLWVKQATPCKSEEMSSEDIFKRHVKRFHFYMAKDIPSDVRDELGGIYSIGRWFKGKYISYTILRLSIVLQTWLTSPLWDYLINRVRICGSQKSQELKPEISYRLGRGLFVSGASTA
jgi:hypothetical protein